jgi:N-terminal domain of anti-restriction factor ArdC
MPNLTSVLNQLQQERNRLSAQLKGVTNAISALHLVAALEAGQSEVLAQYLNTMARFHNYSFGNVMLIARQNPEATHVAGIRMWNLLGRFVKKGEKGILIVAPMIGRKKTNVAEEFTADAKDTTSQLFGFRAVYVFDRLSRDLRPSLCAPDGCRRWHIDNPLDSSKHIIAQSLCPMQRIPAGAAHAASVA